MGGSGLRGAAVAGVGLIAFDMIALVGTLFILRGNLVAFGGAALTAVFWAPIAALVASAGAYLARLFSRDSRANRVKSGVLAKALPNPPLQSDGRVGRSAPSPARR